MTKKDYKKGRQMVTIWLDKEQHKDLKLLAKLDRRTMSAYIRAILDEKTKEVRG